MFLWKKCLEICIFVLIMQKIIYGNEVTWNDKVEENDTKNNNNKK